MVDISIIHIIYQKDLKIWKIKTEIEKRKWWMISADFQRWYVALSTTETNQTVFDFLCKTTLQSIVFRAFLRWAWGLVCIFSATSVCLGFHSSLLSQQTVACKSSQLSVGSYIRSESFCIFPTRLPFPKFLDVSFWKYSTIPHVISSQWFQAEHFPNYFHPHNHISIPVSAFPCPCCCIIWNTLYQHNHAPNTNIINGL